MALATEPGLERIVDERQVLGESPVWSVRDRALWWVDLRAPAVLCFTPSTRSLRQWPMPRMAGGVALERGGTLLVALADGLHRFDPASGQLDFVVAVAPPRPECRMNETRVDRRGRLWTSTMRDFGADDSGALFRVDGPTRVACLVDRVRVPNALAWSPDDRTMYFADTRDERLRAYAFDMETGTLGAMRVLIAPGAVPGRPDGAAVDAEGCVWSARFGGACVVRVTPEGRVDRIVQVPASQVTACTFGDDDFRTLYITTGRQRMTPAEEAAEPLAGAVFALRVPVGGLAEPESVLRD